MNARPPLGYTPRYSSQGRSPRRNTDLPLGWIVGGGALVAILLLLFIVGSTSNTDQAEAGSDASDLAAIVDPALTRAGYGDVVVEADGRTVTISGEVATRADVVAATAVVNSIADVAFVINNLTYLGEPDLGDAAGPDVEGTPVAPAGTSTAALLLQSALSGIAAREPIQFQTGSDQLTPESASTIAQVAQLMIDNPSTRVEIGGHTDSDGEEEANKALSQTRADAVLGALIGAGVEADRMVAIGYGEVIPVASNETQDGKARNRRIEFLILL